MATANVGLARDQWHRYTWNGDGPLVGVTSVLKIQDVLMGGDLAAWGARIAIESILSNASGDPMMREHALAAVSAARDIGTAVHAQIERILRGQPAIPTPRTAPYIYAFTSFLAAERPEFLEVEAMVANLTYRYAGTFDFAARIRGRVALVDVKTGKAKLSHRLQLAGYAAAEFIGKEGDPEKYPLPRFRDFYILLLRPGEYELVPLEVRTHDKGHFLGLVKTYQRIREWQEAAA
jgi:hypothetical protein